MKPDRNQRWLISVLVLLVISAAGYGAVAGSLPFAGSPYTTASEPYQGAGGDPVLLDLLVQNGVDLQQVNALALAELRSTLKDAPGQFILYRGTVRHNLLQRGLAGFQVCAYADPFSAGLLRNVAGQEFACAITDANGQYTFIGLPSNTELTFVTSRPGFLKLAFTTRTSLPPEYEQDFVGSVPTYLVSGLYQRDARYPFCAAGNCPQGEMVFTIIREARAQDDPLFGYASPGMYTGNGVPGVTIQVFTDADHTGTFASPYPTLASNNPNLSLPDTLPDGLVYSGTLEEDLNHATNDRYAPLLDFFANVGLQTVLRKQEYPQLWRTETSGFGLALLKYMEPGVYEAEVTHPTLACHPANDAWVGSTPTRLRFEIIPGALGDVRFYCEEQP